MTVIIAQAGLPAKLADLVQETTQTVGTGAYVLDGVPTAAAALGMRGFVAAVGNGQPTVYRAFLGSAWEIVVGTVTAGASNTLSRDFVIESTNGGAAIEWGPGFKTIIGVLPATLAMQIPAELPLPRGYIDGFQMALAADVDHDITFGIGTCRSSGNASNIASAAAITKRFDATWAVGSGNGGMQSGSSIANDTWYEAYAIKRSDTGVVDVIGVPEAGSLSLPAGYDLSRRIGYFRSDGAANILAFLHRGDRFMWAVPHESSVAIPTNTGSGTLYSLRVPNALLEALISITIATSDADELARIWAFDPAVTGTADVDTSAPRSLSVRNVTGGVTATASGQFRIGTNSAGQIRIKSGSAPPTGFNVWTEGWIDRRGKDA